MAFRMPFGGVGFKDMPDGLCSKVKAGKQRPFAKSDGYWFESAVYSLADRAAQTMQASQDAKMNHARPQMMATRFTASMTKHPGTVL
jgi:hypothetical protein